MSAAEKPHDHAIETMLLEERRYPPSPEFAAQANAKPEIYDEASRRSGSGRAASGSPGSSRSRELSSGSGRTRSGISAASSTSAYNCVDRHVEAGRGDKVAFFWEGEPEGERRDDHLRRSAARGRALRERAQDARGRKGHPGRRSTWGWSPRLPIAMLACARLGAPHTVVFGGFSADSLSDRLNDMGCEVLITQDEAWRRGSTGRAQDDRRRGDGGRARRRRRCARPAPHRRRRADDRRGATTGGTSVASDRRLRRARPSRWTAEDLLYLLYTSGTTAKPKGIVHTTAGYLVGVATTHHYVFDLKPETDVYWCAADVGWVTGHSYIVYGPLCNGATSRHVRGHARLPRQGPLVGDRRALRGRRSSTRRRPRSART